MQHCGSSAKLKNGTFLGGILVSVIVAQTLSRPWTWLPDMQNPPPIRMACLYVTVGLHLLYIVDSAMLVFMFEELINELAFLL